MASTANPSPTPQEARSQTAVPLCPKRPKSWDAEVRRAAAEDLATEVAEWMEVTADEHLITALAEAMRGNRNGYEMAQELERRLSLSPDAQLVEILDNNGLWEAERRAVQAWVQLTHAKADLPDGTMVKWANGTGEVTGRDEVHATYTVWNYGCHSEKQPRCGWVLPAEDCTPVGSAEGGAAGSEGEAEAPGGTNA